MDSFPEDFTYDEMRKKFAKDSLWLKQIRKEIFESINEKGYYKECKLTENISKEIDKVCLELDILLEELRTKNFQCGYDITNNFGTYGYTQRYRLYVELIKPSS
jgi:hypothetical protein